MREAIFILFSVFQPYIIILLIISLFSSLVLYSLFIYKKQTVIFKYKLYSDIFLRGFFISKK